jgi:hypothetical protein
MEKLMRTPDGCELTKGSPVIVHATYLGPHPVGGGRVALTTGGRERVTFDVPIAAVELNRSGERAEWLAIAKPMGLRGKEGYYLGLYRRTNTGDYGRVSLWGGPDEEHLDGVFQMLSAMGAVVFVRTDLEGTGDDPLPELIETAGRAAT